MNHNYLLLCTMIFLGVVSCGIDAEDRCSEGYVLKGTTCLPIGDQSGELGETCETENDCGLDGTDYCAKDPTKPQEPGMCTFKDCLPDPDSCPEGYQCCDIPEELQGMSPDLCVPKAQWEIQKAFCSG